MCAPASFIRVLLMVGAALLMAFASFPLCRYDLDALPFCPVPAAGAEVSLSWLLAEVPAEPASGDALRWRSLAGGLQPVAVAANGSRGVACVLSPKSLTLFDVEEDEDEGESKGESVGEGSQAGSSAGGDEKGDSSMEERKEEGPLEESKGEEEGASDMSNSL
jgi:hypothetical protein